MLSREEVERRLEECWEYPTSLREALQTAQALYAERDEAWASYKQVLNSLLVEQDKLAVEGRKLYDLVQRAVIDGNDVIAEAAVTLFAEGLNATVIAAEVERVKRLEAVAKAADHVYLVMPSAYVPNGEGAMKVWVVVRDMEDLRAALAAWREREGGGAA